MQKVADLWEPKQKFHLVALISGKSSDFLLLNILAQDLQDFRRIQPNTVRISLGVIGHFFVLLTEFQIQSDVVSIAGRIRPRRGCGRRILGYVNCTGYTAQEMATDVEPLRGLPAREPVKADALKMRPCAYRTTIGESKFTYFLIRLEAREVWFSSRYDFDAESAIFRIERIHDCALASVVRILCQEHFRANREHLIDAAELSGQHAVANIDILKKICRSLFGLLWFQRKLTSTRVCKAYGSETSPHCFSKAT